MTKSFPPSLLALSIFCAASASAATGHTEARNDGMGGSGVTVGVGLSPISMVHLDLAGMAGTDHTYGVSAQLTFTF